MHTARSRLAAPLIIALLGTSVASTASASRVTPKTGSYEGVTSQRDAIALDVGKRHGKTRVTGIEVHFRMDCEDGSSIARSAHLPGARLSRGGGFRVDRTARGSYGSSGRIRVTVELQGRFTGARSAEGSFRASAALSKSAGSPVVACFTGDNGWVVR